jgi:hypothetical protein
MDPHSPAWYLMTLSDALGDLRDSLVLISMALSDHLTESASPLRDEVLAQVERHLARIGEGKQGTID